MQRAVLPAKRAGYDAIAWDNYNLYNDIKACGHYDEAGGWVQLYNGTNESIAPSGRAKYANDVLQWTERITAASHKVLRRAPALPLIGPPLLAAPVTLC